MNEHVCRKYPKRVENRRPKTCLVTAGRLWLAVECDHDNVVWKINTIIWRYFTVWFIEAEMVQIRRLVDTQLRRLRFWTYTRNLTGPSPLTLCRHCQQVYDPVHYLLNCPTYPKHRRILKVHLRPEDYKMPDHYLAALIIRKSTFLSDIITPLLQKDHYTHHQQQ